ncbi:transcription initiation factor TFIID subunit 4B-like [Watersipora subatra]|uniref:transcription initiation factor TFIID subunit 4B-like n=1 Tax=Watersipora subatra TaxID=2589382 RepID=UPI00355C72D1
MANHVVGDVIIKTEAKPALSELAVVQQLPNLANTLASTVRTTSASTGSPLNSSVHNLNNRLPTNTPISIPKGILRIGSDGKVFITHQLQQSLKTNTSQPTTRLIALSAGTTIASTVKGISTTPANTLSTSSGSQGRTGVTIIPPRSTHSHPSGASINPNVVLLKGNTRAVTDVEKLKSFLEKIIVLTEERATAAQRSTVKQAVRKLLQGFMDGEAFIKELENVLKCMKQPNLASFIHAHLAQLRRAICEGRLSIVGCNGEVIVNKGTCNATGVHFQESKSIKLPSAGGATVLVPLQHSVVRGAARELGVRFAPVRGLARGVYVRTPTLGGVARGTAVRSIRLEGTAGGVPVGHATMGKVYNVTSAKQDVQRLVAGGVSVKQSSLKPVISHHSQCIKREPQEMCPILLSRSLNTIPCYSSLAGPVMNGRNHVGAVQNGGIVTVKMEARQSPDLFDLTLTQQYMNNKLSAAGLKPSKSEILVRLIIASCRERLRQLLLEAILAADHRIEIYKKDVFLSPSFEPKGALQFLGDLAKVEQQKNENEEKEMLLRVMKTRFKVGDSEQLKLKQRAKEASYYLAMLTSQQPYIMIYLQISFVDAAAIVRRTAIQ